MIETTDNNIEKERHNLDDINTNFDEQEHQKLISEINQEKEISNSENLATANLLKEELTSNDSIPDWDTKNKQQEKIKEDETKYIKGLIFKNNIEWIVKYIWFDKKILDKIKPINIWKIKAKDLLDDNLAKEIESLNKAKKISEVDSFLGNENGIIEETQKEYESLHKKMRKIKEWKDNSQGYIFLNLLKKLFKELKILKNSNRLFGHMYKNLMYKKITKNIIEAKDAVKEKRKWIAKNLKKLKEYERWEYINFPNWITFELWKWPENIPWTEINIWENEFYIKTHIEKNKKEKKTKYIEYVDSLKKARALFEKKWIKIQYCKRQTWLVNREFIEAYELQRKKRKEIEWSKYEKSNRLKVLEQTEKAIVSYRKKKEGKSPIKFIDEKQDRNLFEFAQNNDNFCEAEMWLDLNLL